MPVSWTDERIERLKTLWTEGVTANAIANDLGGVSRNAVIGKAHRLGLEARPSPVKANDVAEALQADVTPEAEAAEDAQAEPAGVAPGDTADLVDPPASLLEPETPAPAAPVMRSVGPGGFVRQTPGEAQSPIPPAPPRRLVPAKPSPAVANKTGLLDLNERICKWPMGHPGEPDFHFCGKKANPGFPYCVDHCGVAYQAQMPRRDRRPPPPLPYGGPRVR